MADLVRVLGDTASGQSRRRPGQRQARPTRCPSCRSLDEMWGTHVDPDDAGADEDAVEGLRTAERQLTDYRHALHDRIDEATRELILRYRANPLAALARHPTGVTMHAQSQRDRPALLDARPRHPRPVRRGRPESPPSAPRACSRCCSTAAPSTSRRGAHRRGLGRARVRRAPRVPGGHGRRRRCCPPSSHAGHACCRCGGENGELVVAVSIRQAGNIELKDDLSRMARRRVRFAIANRAEIETKINQVYRAEGELHDLTSDLTSDEDDGDDLANFTEVTDEAPVVRFVNLLISQAITDRASDIHIEPTERDLRVRYRIDGVLHDAHRSPKNIQNGVISRLKIMADMNIAERRVPQDGRMSVNHDGRKIDLRVATLPTVWGEKVVVRILDNTNTQLGLCRPRLQRRQLPPLRGVLLQAVRDDPGHRPDRVGQVDDAVRDAEPAQPARGQRDHRRGPGGVPPGRHQPGADQRQGRADLRLRAALDPALGPRHRADR